MNLFKKLLAIPVVLIVILAGCVNPLEEQNKLAKEGESNGSEVVGIQGKVLNGNGQPIEGVTVSLRKENFLFNPLSKVIPPNSDTHTDGASQFHFDMVETGNYLITAMRDSVTGSSLPVSVTNPDSLVKVEVRLKPLGSLHGGVTIEGSLKNLMPKYAQLFGTDYYAELIHRETIKPKNEDGYKFFGAFFMPNIPAGTYKIQLSDDGQTNILNSPSNEEYLIEPGKVSEVLSMGLRTIVNFNTKLQTTQINESDTVYVFSEDFPLKFNFRCDFYIEGIRGNLFWFKSIKWRHQEMVVTLPHPYVSRIQLEESEVPPKSLDSVTLQLENWGGTVTNHTFYISQKGKKWEGDEPFPKLLDSIVASYINSPSGVVYFPSYTGAELNSPLSVVYQYWNKKAISASHFDKLQGCLRPILNRMTLDQKVAISIFFNPDSLTPDHLAQLKSMAFGELSFALYRIICVLKKADILAIENQGFVNEINFAAETATTTKKRCNDSLKLALAEKGIDRGLREWPYGVIYVDDMGYGNSELKALSNCQISDTAGNSSSKPKISSTIGVLMEKLGATDSIVVTLFPQSDKEVPRKSQEPTKPSDSNDSLAWENYLRTLNEIEVEHQKFQMAIERGVKNEMIEHINQNLGRDITKSDYFRMDTYWNWLGIRAVLLKHEIALLAGDPTIHSIHYPGDLFIADTQQ